MLNSKVDVNIMNKKIDTQGPNKTDENLISKQKKTGRSLRKLQ